MGPLITAAELDPSMRLLDVRMGSDAEARYRAGHLEGAVFVDVERDLTGDARDPSVGGRHPLPTVEAWAETLGRLGVGPSTRVAIYDDAAGAKAAARMWWMLRASGHLRVAVLDGGLAAAGAYGFGLTDAVPEVPALPPYPVDGWSAPTVSMDEVDARRRDPRYRVIDVRSAARYRGEEEPYEPVAGHIAGAVSAPLTLNLDGAERFLAPDALRARYEALLEGTPPERVVVSCGSGITACHTLLALERAGLPGAALYVGSFSEWSRAGGAVAPEPSS